MNAREIFGSKLLEAMKARGLSRRELASILGVSEVSITQYINGRYEPNLENLIKIADVLDISIDELVGREYTIRQGKIYYSLQILLNCGCSCYIHKDSDSAKSGLYVVLPREFRQDSGGVVLRDSQHAMIFHDVDTLADFVEGVVRDSIASKATIRDSLFKNSEPLYLSYPVDIDLKKNPIKIPEGVFFDAH